MLTRHQIDMFCAFAERLPEIHPDAVPDLWVSVCNIVALTDDGRVVLTPAGEDLLATVPHLPRPDPVQAPSCDRCGGLGEVPLFQSMANTMPCPKCRPEKPAATEVSPDPEVRLTPWIHIYSDLDRPHFDYKRVELHAPSGTDADGVGFAASDMHERVGQCSWSSDGFFFIDNVAVSWHLRGNVYLRLVSE